MTVLELSVPRALVAGTATIVAVGLFRLARRAPARPDRSEPASAGLRVPLDALIAAQPDPVVVIDGAGNVLAFNGPASAMAPALRRGGPAALALRMPEIVKAIRSALSSGQSQRAEYSERVPLDRWYEAHVAPVRPGGADGSPAMLAITFRDLTPLRRIDEMRSDFVANASHELRTPLASLVGFIETLQRSARDDPAARERFLGIMQGQAARMARLIDDLLSLSRIELNVHRRPDSSVDIVSVVRQVVDAMQTLARDREVAVHVSMPAEPVIVRGDRDELVRVFENLIENALKYGASGKRVDVTLARPAGDGPDTNVIVTVRDYGPGIPPEHLPRLTERFYRVDVGHSRAEGGTGLGLAIVKHILARHRGRLVIDSVAGAGAAFSVQLPQAVARES